MDQIRKIFILKREGIYLYNVLKLKTMLVDEGFLTESKRKGKAV